MRLISLCVVALALALISTSVASTKPDVRVERVPVVIAGSNKIQYHQVNLTGFEGNPISCIWNFQPMHAVSHLQCLIEKDGLGYLVENKNYVPSVRT